MDCFPDYCLACDKQINDGLYCSQTCRLADIERAGSHAASPTTPLSPTQWTSPYHSHGSNTRTNSAFAPASSYTSHNHHSRHRSPSDASLDDDLRPTSPRTTAVTQHTASTPSTPFHILSPSSSHSSLNSTISGMSSRGSEAGSSDGLSDEARNELKGYFDALGHTLEKRRRSYPLPAQVVRFSTGMPPVPGYEDDH